MQEDHVRDVEDEADQVIAPRFEAEELISQALDQPAERLIDAALERREGKSDLFPTQTAERIVLQDPLRVIPINEPVAIAQVRKRSRRTRSARPRPARVFPGPASRPF